MKLIVFSDSHGLVAPMREIILRKKPDAVAHLGDYARDAEALRDLFPALISVCGNCDWGGDAPLRAEFELGGVRVFACHGHRYGVKTDLDALCNAGYFAGAGLVLFGHTHVPMQERIGEMLVLNPGSARRSYAEIELEGGEIVSAEIKQMEN